MKRLLILMILCSAAAALYAQDKPADTSTRRERNYVREGNDLYEQKRYADAEVAYRKAVEENPMSEAALYNLALSLIRQAGTTDPNAENSPLKEAQSLLGSLAESAQSAEIAEKALYNLGNMAFNQEQYDQAIGRYKGALRRNPDNAKTRTRTKTRIKINNRIRIKKTNSSNNNRNART